MNFMPNQDLFDYRELTVGGMSVGYRPFSLKPMQKYLQPEANQKRD